MLKVKNLGNKFTSISAGVIDHDEVKDIALWELKLLLWAKTYNLQIIME